MGIFSRKKKETEQPKDIDWGKMLHEHTWKDMPWYMDVAYNSTNKTASYKIIEPYICITCGERKNIVLEEEGWSNIDSEWREKYFTRVRRRYKKYLKPKAIVEDMINNILLVKDPSRLEMIEKMRGTPHQNCGTSAEMKQVFETDEEEKDVPKIEVDDE